MSGYISEKKLIDNLFDRLWPLTRSITGPGLEQSLAYFSEQMDLRVEKIPTGSKVFDWIVPPEWHFSHARLTGPDGEVVCDSRDSNLHVVNYSEPVDEYFELDRLQQNLHSLPALPSAIPYVTSYYKRSWGFCLSDQKRQQLKPGRYHAKIEAQFISGGVPFGHTLLPGESQREVLLSSYLCHPSLANNELSGPLTLLLLYLRLATWKKRRFSYRFLLNPETIGSLCFLSKYHRHLKESLAYGLILTCVGGSATSLRYKMSRSADSILDKVIKNISNNQLDSIESVRYEAFSPIGGSDERQYGAPGFKLPVGQISRTVYGHYLGYHNSLDTKEFMDVDALIRSADTIEQILRYAEWCGYPINCSPYGEPQLGPRGLYPNMNSEETRASSSDSRFDSRLQLNRMLLVLSMADGTNSLFDIANAAGCCVEELRVVIEKLENSGLIKYGIDFIE
ncbi:DUF4910 domain-containing protein [Ectothiorhodospiraceae bacterium BW-2]|nr:DUF4910 domain-containing protein [Ectothiorhodospiraceae bacterium BW-2]